MSIRNKILPAISWNATGVIVYKIILALHQIFLFPVIKASMYGRMGIHFALLYFIISITNFGFDYTLFPLFTSLQQKNKKNVFSRYFMVHCLLLLASLVCIYTGIGYAKPSLLCSPLLLCALSYTESIKKTYTMMCMLLFKNKQIAYTQIAALILYLTLVWSHIYRYASISLYMMFLFFFVVSIIELVCIIILYYTHTNMPAIKQDTNHVHAITIKTFIQNYINQLAKAVTSLNFLLIFIAGVLEIATLGFIKLILTFFATGHMLASRMFGITIGSIIANIQADQSMQHLQKSYFISINKKHLLFFKGLFLVATGIILVSLQYNLQTLIIITMVIAISSFDYIMITYEKAYIARHQQNIIMYVNSLLLGVVMSIAYATYAYQVSLYISLGMIMAAKTIIFYYVQRHAAKLF